MYVCIAAYVIYCFYHSIICIYYLFYSFAETLARLSGLKKSVSAPLNAASSHSTTPQSHTKPSIKTELNPPVKTEPELSIPVIIKEEIDSKNSVFGQNSELDDDFDYGKVKPTNSNTTTNNGSITISNPDSTIQRLVALADDATNTTTSAAPFSLLDGGSQAPGGFIRG